MVSLSEKPELTYQVNTGVYILNPAALMKYRKGIFHITHDGKNKGKNWTVGCFL